jgi:peptide/nickel transport system permease protein
MRRGYARFLGRRLSAAVLLALGATLIAFMLVQVVPADPVTANLSDQALGDPSAIAAFRKTWGLDQPLPVQYWDYLKNLAHGNLGMSQQTHRPVIKDLEEFVPATFELAIPAMLLAGIIGVALGTFAAVRRGKPSDQAVRLVSLLGLSTPPFWLAILALYVFFFKLGWFPSGDRLSAIAIPPPKTTGFYTIDAMLHGQWSVASDAAKHLVLPVCVLAAYIVGLLTRFTRSAVLEVLENDYVRTARAKGLPPHVVLFRHTLRAALVPVITVSGLAFGSLLSGTVLVESIFSWPGVGQYAYKSALSLDLRAIMGVSLFVAIVYVVVNLLVDMLYGIIDPRIRVT